MNYTIIGNDGKTYGPAGAEQIRQWISQQRVESRTPVIVEGASDWTFLGLLPEFAPEFSGPPPTIAPLKPGYAQAPRTNPYAVAGLVCGLLSWLCCFCCCAPFHVLGIVFSLVALTQIRSRPEQNEGRGLAVAGLVLSITGLLLSLGFIIYSWATNMQENLWNSGLN
jgi:hypothetical protein